MRTNFSTVLKEAEGFTRRLARAGVKEIGFPDQAALLTQASALRIHATEAALGLADGTDRYLLLRLRDSAAETERGLEKRLGRSTPCPTPGNAA